MRIESYRISSLRLAVLLACCCCYLLPGSRGFSSSLPLTSRWQKCPNPAPSVSPTFTSTSRHHERRFANDGSTHASLSILFSSTVPRPSSSPTTNRKEKNKPEGQRDHHHHHHHQNNKPTQGKSKGRIIRSMFHTAKDMERQGRWAEALGMYEKILRKDPSDAHTHLALARLEARRELKSRLHAPSRNTNTTVDHIMPTSKAQRAFEKGTVACPKSVHLWQAWAVFEESCGNVDRARELFQQALNIDEHNPFACHAYGLMEKKLGNTTKARQLFEQALEKKSTAALVCSLGELLIANDDFKLTRDLYVRHLLRLETERENTEVYLASAWLEERYFNDYRRALELIELALAYSPGSSLANVALARLEGRIQKRKGKWTGRDATRRRVANACIDIEKGLRRPSDPNDGRLFNTWANIEVKSSRYSAARKILKKGMQMHPNDHSLLQAAGKVEERLGNFAGARNFYSRSLVMEPSAPTLVAYALLEMRDPESGQVNHTRVNGLFEEALLMDPRHGPAYNAYGNAEFHRGHNDEARAIFERGVRAECFDVASVYHGYGKIELSLGNVETARDILRRGLEEVRRNDVSTDSPHRERAKFLCHTLGMLELNSNRPSDGLAVFQEGISRCGNSSQLLLGSALCEVKLGKEDAARVLFERAVLSDKKHAQAWQAWGVMETRAGNYNAAATLFKCGIKSTPTHGALWHGYASLETRRGNIRNARTLFAGGVKKAPHYTALYQGWASLELFECNYEAAKTLITKALTKDKRNGPGWLVAAHIEREQGNAGLEGLLLRRGIECAPNDAELYRSLGEYLVGRNKIDDAREVFEKGIEVNPLHAPLYHSLAELEARVFNLGGLATLNKRAAKFFNNNALVPSLSSSEAWGTKIRSGRSRNLPKGVAALAQKIVDDEEDSTWMGGDEYKLDPMITLDKMSAHAMEDDLVRDLLGVDAFDKKK